MAVKKQPAHKKTTTKKGVLSMNRISVKSVTLLMGALVLFTAGCAQVAQKVDVLYSPLATYRGGSGALDLV